jgi:hypothetical protein
LIFKLNIKVPETGIKMRLSSVEITPKNILLAVATQANTFQFLPEETWDLRRRRRDRDTVSGNNVGVGARFFYLTCNLLSHNARF